VTKSKVLFACPACGAQQSVRPSLAGRKIRCPQCGETAVAVEPPATAPAAPGKAAIAAAPDDAEPEVDVKSTREEPDMDMTPMIDVTFQLLIFFTVTASFCLQKAIGVPPPKETNQPSTQAMEQPEEDEETELTVVVDEFNTFIVVTSDGEFECPSEQEMFRRLKEAAQGDSQGRVPKKLVVRAHGESLHEKVVAALDSGPLLGMEKIELMSIEDDDF
jgi:biopolymer transport protein ExbD